MYQVIARKYRPQTFSELIGQEHVQKTLVNAIENRRLAHGYIFAGQRGTGKTTVARILARCLNCIHGPTPTPCGVCSSCVEIAAGNSVDVIEIDAASNRGINEMREVRENVRYRPARDRYKVFIVDEAHQITKEAFNALLKTLEEPPEWVVFILCTTEANEIPNTIASRCQQFTFRSVDFAELITRMKYIIAQEGIEADEDVLAVIAQAGEGSVRDSLSALDQAIACCGNTLKAEDIRSLLGMFGMDSLSAVAAAVLAKDGGKMLEIVQDLEHNGKSLQHFCRELARYWRNLLVAKIAGKPTRLITATDREQTQFLESASQFSEEDLTRYLNLTLELYKTMQSSLQPRMHLELGLVKLVHASRLQSIEEALAQVSTSSKSTPPLAATSKAGAPRPANFQTRPAKPSADGDLPAAPAVALVPPAPESIAVSSGPPERSGDLKQDLYQALVAAKMNFTADAIQNSEVRLEASDLIVKAPKMMTLALKDTALQRIASQIAGKPVRLRIEVDDTRQAVATAGASTGESSDTGLRDRALSHPGVKRFQELFPGAQVRTVRNLNE
ncbi:MAG TPA: DNA polymerase III subunit gamma/tau [Bryobacteraceae bacterium]|jgi:DNA polymerase-3 subunit gamma/tau|nr:DNA polymerase III subunit gamma/tau [Bryobacteraceae bacterium]